MNRHFTKEYVHMAHKYMQEFESLGNANWSHNKILFHNYKFAKIKKIDHTKYWNSHTLLGGNVE